jgi:hypothetical protein
MTTAESSLGTAPPPYLCVVGYSWAPALAWSRAFPGEPFLGIRVDTEEVWVVFEPKTSAGPIPRSVFEHVAHRLARRVANILQSGPYRRPLTRPLVSMNPASRGHRASRSRSIQLGLFD